jgi:cellulose synthase/poly-beta-1,6-N-acetylglucosamine synthase-like glycosyltransferase
MGFSHMFRAVGTSAIGTEPRAPRVTVVVLLYNAADEVPELVEGLVRQRHPVFASQSLWLDALFVDDASQDDTVPAVKRALVTAGAPAHYRLVAHPRNLGLAGTLNEVFAEATTPFVLTCHLDCRFGGDEYVASMLELMARHPDAAAITGQPTLPTGERLSFAEKTNVVVNLMDVLPERTAAELVPVGFAEGRCDIFRVEALRAVGLYDARLRTSGEDQVLAAKLRATGFSIYKAARLGYRLSVSGEQDSVGKLIRHQRLFGRTTPYILLAVPGSVRGLLGPQAGANRTRRAVLRAAQLAGGSGCAFGALSILLGWSPWPWASALVLVLLAKLALQYSHAQIVRFSPLDWLAWLAIQLPLDVAFAVGTLEGLALLASGRTRSID